MRILMPAPQGVSGPMPRLAELLAAALRGEGCDVTILPWGGGSGRALGARVLDRGREVNRLRRAASWLEPDAILVQTSHDWACIMRDTALALAVRRHGSKIVLLNFAGVDFLSSTGIALIVGILARARKDGRLISASGLSDHYKEIFEITRLADFMTIYPDERTALGDERGGE